MREATVDLSRAVLSKHSRSFDWASKFLPPSRRDAAAVLYAFCRRVDDAVDEAPDDEAARENLERLRRQLDGQVAPRPVVAGFHELAERYGVPPEAAGELIDGVDSDIGSVRVQNDGELLRYCYRVAGTVGLMMSPILGVSEPVAHRHAVDLGIGMQITNICRDVLEDAARNRVYLPAERLEAAGTSHRELLEGTADRKAVADVVSDLLHLADRYYSSADHGVRYIPLRSRLAIVIASRVYRAIGVRLRERNDCDPLGGRTVVPAPEKLKWVIRGIGSFIRPDIAGLGPPAAHDHSLHVPLDGTWIGGAAR